MNFPNGLVAQLVRAHA